MSIPEANTINPPVQKDKAAGPEEAYRNVVSEFMVERARRPQSFSMEKPHYHPYYEIYFLISRKLQNVH